MSNSALLGRGDLVSDHQIESRQCKGAVKVCFRSAEGNRANDGLGVEADVMSALQLPAVTSSASASPSLTGLALGPELFAVLSAIGSRITIWFPVYSQKERHGQVLGGRSSAR